MAVSASAKSRAAAVSSLIRRDAGFSTGPATGRKYTGIVVRAGEQWPTIEISDQYHRPADDPQSQYEISYRAEYVSKSLSRRGYTYDYTLDAANNIAHFTVTGKSGGSVTVEGRRLHKAVIQFAIDPEAAAAYLNSGETDEVELAKQMAQAFWDILQNSNAYRECALDVNTIDLV